MMPPMDEHAARELELYINNDGSLDRSQTTPIRKNLVTKRARGEYRHDLAVKLFGYLVEAGAKKYAKEFPGQPWHKMFSVAARKRVAEALTRAFEGEAAFGNYDYLLPKKYQKAEKAAVQHARKKVAIGRPSSKRARLKAIEARRQALTAVREMLSSSASGITAQDIRTFRGFLRNASNSQVQDIYEKEKRAGRDEYAELAGAEAMNRGITLDDDRYDHARKKSPSQLKHEIAAVLGTRRYS